MKHPTLSKKSAIFINLFFVSVLTALIILSIFSIDRNNQLNEIKNEVVNIKEKNIIVI